MRLCESKRCSSALLKAASREVAAAGRLPKHLSPMFRAEGMDHGGVCSSAAGASEIVACGEGGTVPIELLPGGGRGVEIAECFKKELFSSSEKSKEGGVARERCAWCFLRMGAARICTHTDAAHAKRSKVQTLERDGRGGRTIDALVLRSGGSP
jgi:hypothetical protein